MVPLGFFCTLFQNKGVIISGQCMTFSTMGLYAIGFRPNISEMKAINRSCIELSVNRSELMRAALSQWLHILYIEGVVSEAPPIRH